MNPGTQRFLRVERTLLKLALVWISVTGAAGSVAAPPPWLPPLNAITHAIHISLDGLGGVYLREYLAKAPGDFPSFRRLWKEGAGTFNARCDYHISLTEPNHASILTGRPVVQQPANVSFSAPHGFTANYDPGPYWTIHNFGNPQVPYKASVLDVAHDHGLGTAFYAGKQKFDMYVRSYDAAHGAPDEVPPDNGRGKIDQYAILDWTGPHVTEQQSSNLVSRVVEALRSDAPPRYVFLHLTDPDIFGHYYGWGSPTYRACVENMDRQLGRILAAIEASPVLSNRTVVVATADHGGGDILGSHLYPDALPVYTVPMVLWGPGVPAGVDLYRLFSNRADPGTNYLDYNAVPAPLWNGDTPNIALAVLGLPSIPGSCLVPEFGPTPVLLSIRRTSTEATLSWSASAEGYHLEFSDSCEAGPWQPIEERIIEDGGTKRYTVGETAAVRTRFYRLGKVSPP